MSRCLRACAGIVRHLVLLVVAGFALLPFMVMASTSMRSPEAIFAGGLEWWPKDPAGGAANFAAGGGQAPLLLYLVNGVVVTLAIFLLQVLVALPAAYALAKLRFPGRRVAFAVVLFCLLIPYHAIAVPLFLMLHAAGLLDGYSALILPFIVSAFGIFLMRQFFVGIPDDLVDAARMDGISEFGIVWRVMLPSAIPALTAFGIFSIVAHWNDYFWPLVAVSDGRYFTPPLGVVAFRNAEAGNDYGPLMAAATLIVLPLVALFLLAQRRFVDGVAFTGVK